MDETTIDPPEQVEHDITSPRGTFPLNRPRETAPLPKAKHEIMKDLAFFLHLNTHLFCLQNLHFQTTTHFS